VVVERQEEQILIQSQTFVVFLVIAVVVAVVVVVIVGDIGL